MSTLQSRGSIALTAIVVVLLASRTADAQIFIDQGPPRHPVGLCDSLVTGVFRDAADEAHAEHRLQHLQAKLGRHSEQGNVEAVNHDLRRIDNTRYRIAVDDWLIRKNSLQCTGYYPMRNVELPCTEPCNLHHHKHSSFFGVSRHWGR